MTDETIVWLPSRQQCKDVSSLDSRIGQASSRSIVVGTTDYMAASTLGEGRWWSQYRKDPAREQQLQEEYRTKHQKWADRIFRGREETVNKYIQQKHTRQIRDQSQVKLDQLSNQNMDQLSEESRDQVSVLMNYLLDLIEQSSALLNALSELTMEQLKDRVQSLHDLIDQVNSIRIEW